MEQPQYLAAVLTMIASLASMKVLVSRLDSLADKIRESGESGRTQLPR